MTSLFFVGVRKISSQLYLGFAVPAVAILGMGVFSLYSFAQIDQKIGTIYDDRVIPLQQIKSISDNYGIHVIDAVNKVDQGLLSPPAALKEITLATEQIEQAWQQYRQTQLTAEEKSLVQEIERLFVPANRQITELKAVLRQGDRQALSAFNGGLYRTVDPLTSKLQELSDLQLQTAQQERNAADILYRQTSIVFSFLLLFALLLASPLGYFMSRVITRTFKETIDHVAQASQDIAVATEEHERIASQQAAAIHQTSSTMDELGTSAQHSAEQAETAAVGAQKVSVLSSQGMQSVNHTLQTMAALKTRVEEISEQISHLNHQTSQIGLISGLVADLANQTNLLSLNAAVEATRAGTQGKGFAVVAAEIRKLADQSKEAAKKINVLVGDIQTAIDATVRVTEFGTKTVEKGVETVQRTAEAFSDMSNAIDAVTLSSQQISLNVKQQAIAIQQVVDAMVALNKAAVQTASGIQQTKVGTQQLQQVTQRLQETV